MALNLQETQRERSEQQARWRAEETLPESTYTFLLTGRELGKSKANNPKIVLDWTVQQGQWQGASVRDHLTFSMKALFRVNMLLEAIGVEIPDRDFDSLEDLREWVFGWLNIGTRVEGVVKHEQYEDEFKQTRTSAKLTRYQEAPGGNPSVVAPSDVPEAKPDEFVHPKPADDDKPPF